jgi:hypothetical protein
MQNRKDAKHRRARKDIIQVCNALSKAGSHERDLKGHRSSHNLECGSPRHPLSFYMEDLSSGQEKFVLEEFGISNLDATLTFCAS